MCFKSNCNSELVCVSSESSHDAITVKNLHVSQALMQFINCMCLKPLCSLELACVSSHHNMYASPAMMQLRTCMCLKP